MQYIIAFKICAVSNIVHIDMESMMLHQEVRVGETDVTLGEWLINKRSHLGEALPLLSINSNNKLPLAGISFVRDGDKEADRGKC